MLRIPRFAPPETLRVLALFAPSNSECFAFLVSGGPGRFASWPPCANPQKTSGEQALRPAFADLRRVLTIIRLYHFPGVVYNRNRAPLFGVCPTPDASAPRRNTMLPGRPSGPAPLGAPPHPEGIQCFLVALRGPPHSGRLRTPKEHNASWSPFGARPTRSASAPREQGNSQLTLHFSVQHLSHFRYARSGSGKQAFSVYYHQQSLPIYTESPRSNG